MKKIVLFIMFFLIGFSSYSQIQCGPNAGFEYGNFVGWSGGTGRCINVNCDTFTSTPGLVLPNASLGILGRHKISSGTTRDPVCNVIPEVCPWGGQYSLKLGNQNVDWETEDIQYSYTVSATNPIIVYSYAVMLEDPNHPDSLQPAFKTYIKDQSSRIIPCSYYKVNATNMRGYQNCVTWRGTQIWYTNWRNVAIDMSAYVGQTVTLYFQTNDCGWGAHFGFAYIDVIGCYSKQIDINHCGQDSIATLSAPPGFATYRWNTGATTQTITVNVNNYTTITCTYTTVTGCPITMTVNTINFDPIVNFSAPPVCVCENLLTNFTDLTIQNQPVVAWQWDFGDGSPQSTLQNPSHQYLLPGIYTVSLIVTTDIGCRFGTTKQVRVYPCPTITMITHN